MAACHTFLFQKVCLVLIYFSHELQQWWCCCYKGFHHINEQNVLSGLKLKKKWEIRIFGVLSRLKICWGNSLQTAMLFVLKHGLVSNQKQVKMYILCWQHQKHLYLLPHLWEILALDMELHSPQIHWEQKIP